MGTCTERKIAHDLSKNDSSATVHVFRRRIAAIFRLLTRYLIVLSHKLHAPKKGHLRIQYLPFEITPAWLVRECLQDIRTACYRIGQRIDKLPWPLLLDVGPGCQLESNGNWVPNMRTHSCMKDMQRYESRFPMATRFDWEMFVTGWQAGAEWREGNLFATNVDHVSNREQKTSDSPIALL
jgi:hypothetical protein